MCRECIVSRNTDAPHVAHVPKRNPCTGTHSRSDFSLWASVSICKMTGCDFSLPPYYSRQLTITLPSVTSKPAGDTGSCNGGDARLSRRAALPVLPSPTLRKGTPRFRPPHHTPARIYFRPVQPPRCYGYRKVWLGPCPSPALFRPCAVI